MAAKMHFSEIATGSPLKSHKSEKPPESDESEPCPKV